MFLLRLSILFIVLFVSLGEAGAASLEAGSPLPGLTLPDQHDKPAALDISKLGVLVFAAERKPGDWAQAVFEKRKDPLVSGQAALVLDISRMPSLVTSMFAMPSFRARPFPILIAREAAPVADLPRKEGHVTVLWLEGGKITSIDYAADEAALETLLNKKAKP